jgi:hypothetical protein
LLVGVALVRVGAFAVVLEVLVAAVAVLVVLLLNG